MKQTTEIQPLYDDGLLSVLIRVIIHMISFMRISANQPHVTMLFNNVNSSHSQGNSCKATPVNRFVNHADDLALLAADSSRNDTIPAGDLMGLAVQH